MKRFHLRISAPNLADSIRFNSALSAVDVPILA